MKGTARRIRTRVRTPHGVAAGVAVLACLALAPAVAQAGVGASATPTFPPEVTAGATGVGGVIELRNTNSDGNVGQVNTVCNFGDGAPCPAGGPGITLIPACSQLGAFSACTGAEPGVFRISDLASGQPGTACAGMVFNVSLIAAATGQVRFTPQGGAHVSLPGAGTVCRIAFTFTVLRVPTGDQNAATPGVQTVQVSDNTQFSGGLTASARGTSLGTTVRKATPAIATSASPDITIGGQVTDTATVTGRVSPVGGTVDFRLYGPDDATCARAPIYQSLGRPLSAAGTATAVPFTPPRSGVYRWRAFYSGDANNEAVTGPCNAVNETVTVVGPPTITVQTTRRGRCVETRFTMRVNVAAQGLRRVRVTLDGKTVKRSTKPRFTLKVRTRALPRGRHVLRIIAVGAGGRTVRTTKFRRCGAPFPPRFVG